MPFLIKSTFWNYFRIQSNRGKIDYTDDVEDWDDDDPDDDLDI